MSKRISNYKKPVIPNIGQGVIKWFATTIAAVTVTFASFTKQISLVTILLSIIAIGAPLFATIYTGWLADKKEELIEDLIAYYNEPADKS